MLKYNKVKYLNCQSIFYILVLYVCILLTCVLHNIVFVVITNCCYEEGTIKMSSAIRNHIPELSYLFVFLHKYPILVHIILVMN